MIHLLTDADAKRRSSAQGSQAAGAARSWCATYPGKGISDNCSYAVPNHSVIPETSLMECHAITHSSCLPIT